MHRKRLSKQITQKDHLFKMTRLLYPILEAADSSSSWNTPDVRYQRSFQQDHERRAFIYVDECIYWLREQFFSSVPWYCHQSLVECILKVIHNCIVICNLG
jgi:hypothetical protein